MNADVRAAFAKLIERQPSEKEVQRLYRVKDALGVADNDALWLILIALESYDNLYSRYPEQLAKHLEAATERQRTLLEDAAKVEANRALSSLAEAVQATSISISKDSRHASNLQAIAWAVLGLTAFGGLCVFVGYVLGSGNVPTWVEGSGHSILWTVWKSIAVMPAGWMVSLICTLFAGTSLWRTRHRVLDGRQIGLVVSAVLLIACSMSFLVPLMSTRV